MKLLDLCCGGGGAAMGYHQAGFDVVGVDIEPQPDYPFEFHQADGLTYLTEHWQKFDVVHASPPCKASTTLTKGTWGNSTGHIDLVGQYRRVLSQLPIPTVVENVKSAQLRPDLTLCGTMFGLKLLRHRLFETNVAVEQPPHPAHQGRVNGWRHGINVKGSYLPVYGNGGHRGSLADWKTAMEIDWMTRRVTLAAAIPPAYTRYIGGQLVRS